MATVSFEDAIASLRSMFPSFDQGVIEAVLEMNRTCMQLTCARPHYFTGSSVVQEEPWNQLSNSF